MLKKILIALAAIVLIFVGVVAMQPSEFHVERTADIARPAGQSVRAGQRLPETGGVVALGQARSRGQGVVRRSAVGAGHGHELGGQR